ncbi:MAG: DUF262 domain-containing protein [Treponema sp.]|jgi:uncharacterized protein with ParB-like and HNH nuclease domain|nr:DUF262 domain-containing protein [Treponema sp.]
MNKKYTLKEFFTDNEHEQIIIPEIQRDYVWKKDNVEHLLKSICDNAEKHKKNLDDMGMTEELLRTLPPKAREAIIEKMEKDTASCNIGFFYAYTDPEMAGRCILIDGQQRMTTLFLLLIYLNIKENQQDKFRRFYFKDDMLKFDYKVRESAHEFLLNFVKYLLDGNNVDDVFDQYWYFSEYKYDMTIQSLLSNYNVIKDYLFQKNLPLEYVEGNIVFWYFDTDKSSQGEELYIYMNSRGESVSQNENIKAALLKDLSEKEKHEWGLKWEEWKNFFWKIRRKNHNADIGFNEFLRWIKTIEYIKLNADSPVEKLSNEIKKIKEQNSIQSDGLSFDLIEKYFNGIDRLIKIKEQLYWKDQWFSEPPSAVNYFVLFPVLMYAIKHHEYDENNFRRFARFFYNIARFDNLSKSPYTALVSIIRIVNKFLEAGYVDVTELCNFKDDFGNILTSEEITKLTIYKLHNDTNRIDIETSFWEAEDFKLCKGTVRFIWDCINYDHNPLSFTDKKYSEFHNCLSVFITLFETPDDLLRRSLLTKGDYKIWDGYSTSLDANRYSFLGNKNSEWEDCFVKISNTLLVLSKNLIIDFIQRKEINPELGEKDVLNNIINDYIESCNNKNWQYYFIKKPEILDYCKEKKVCFYSDDIEEIILLAATKAYYYKPLKDMLKE